jgi:hypothetical protein
MDPSAQRTFELKFLVDDRQAAAVIQWARANLVGDPFALAAADDEYQISSLYFDTPAFDIFRRAPGFRRRKFRIRRYGMEPIVWLERKRKRKGIVSKRRFAIAASEFETRFSALNNRGAANDRDESITTDAAQKWEGDWFVEALCKRQLTPACQVAYRRFARVGGPESSRVRLTVDSEVRGIATAAWRPPQPDVYAALLAPKRHIVELKFADTMPNAFRGLIEHLGLVASGFSKFRAAMAACYDLPRQDPQAGETPVLSPSNGELVTETTPPVTLASRIRDA